MLGDIAGLDAKWINDQRPYRYKLRGYNIHGIKLTCISSGYNQQVG